MKAFDTLFVKYYKLMVANCYFFLRDEQEAKDLVQVFFSEIWEKRLYLNMEGDIKGYLYRSIQNRCLNLQRKQTTEQKKQELFIQAEREIVPENKWTENQYKQLQDALEDMPMQRREALRMIYFEDKKYHDAANEMGISINSLKTHLKIGLRNLREKLTRD